MNKFLDEVQARATSGGLRTILFPEASDPRILEAARSLAAAKTLSPLLVCGSADEAAHVREAGLSAVEIDTARATELEASLLQARASKAGTKDELTPEHAREHAHDPLFYAMHLLHAGEADGLVAGAVRTTAEVIRAGLWLVGKADGVSTVSSSFYMIVPSFRGGGEEMLTFADCGVVPQPTAEQLADIAIAAADARSRIMGDMPRVALLSYSTKGSGGDFGSIAIVRAALDAIKQRRPDMVIDGEMQVDAALNASVSEKKAPGNALGGTANVLVFPSLDAGNIAYKLVAYLVPGAQAFGPILHGFAKPMADLSRGAKTDDIVRIATIVATQATPRDHL